MPLIGANGGLLGNQRTTNTTTAPGLWTPNEQVLLRRANIWPRTDDPYWANVSLLLHMDGTNGSTTFTDSSSNALAVTANGNAQISTAQSRFGGGSAYFDGSGDYLLSSSSPALAMGSGDFTWEAHIYISGGSSYRQIFSTRPGATSSSTAASLALDLSGGLIWWSTTAFVSGSSINGTNTWKHIAVSRSGTTLRVFVDGTLYGSATNSDNLTDQTLSVGANNNGSEPFTGYIDELRITKGVARYTSTFTPPTTAFPNA